MSVFMLDILNEVQDSLGPEAEYNVRSELDGKIFCFTLKWFEGLETRSATMRVDTTKHENTEELHQYCIAKFQNLLENAKESRSLECF